jgi:hypothetical protein
MPEKIYRVFQGGKLKIFFINGFNKKLAEKNSALSQIFYNFIKNLEQEL